MRRLESDLSLGFLIVSGLLVAGPLLAEASLQAHKPISTADLSDGFFTQLRELAGRLGCEPLDLLKVMMSESRVRAAAHNPNGHASGLIQIMPANLPGLGWTGGHEAFRRLSAEQQL